MNALQNERVVELSQYALGKISILDSQDPKAANRNAVVDQALRELTRLQNQLCKEIKIQHLNKSAIVKSCDLADVALRILHCLTDYSQYSCQVNRSCFPCLDKEQLGGIQKKVDEILNRAVFSMNSEELHPNSTILWLKKFPPELSSVEALIGKNGLLSLSVFTRIFTITTEDLLRRCLTNAICPKLETVRDLIHFFSHKPKEIFNSIALVKNHLDSSRERARLHMDPLQKKQFDIQWNASTARDSIYQGKMRPHRFRHVAEKIEAWDFIRQSHLQKEIEFLVESEKPLAHIRLYKGKRGGFYLKIANYFSLDRGSAFFGKENFSKLRSFDNHFWSPNGMHYYSMCSVAREGSSHSYCISFETKEDNPKATIEMHVNNAYASLYRKEKFLEDFERENLAKVKALCALFRANRATIIPFTLTRKPKYLFQMQDGRYIYITFIKPDMSDAHVYIQCSNFSYEQHPVREISRFGGILFTHLTNGGCIYVPAPWEYLQKAHFDDSEGHRYELTELPIQEINHQVTKINPQPSSPRPTMWDLYQPSVA